MTRNIYVIKCHSISPAVADEINEACECLGPQNVFVTYDDTHTQYPDNLPDATVLRAGQGKFTQGLSVMLLNEQEAMKVNKHHTDHKLTYETAWVALKRMLDFEVDYVWTWEQDVVCCGDWKKTLAKADGSTADLLVDSVEGLNWPEWAYDRKYGDWGEDTVVSNAFCACVRLSKRMLDLLDTRLGVVSGFVELYLTTLARKEGLKVENLPKDMLGQFSWVSAQLPEEEDNKLYHSIKL